MSLNPPPETPPTSAAHLQPRALAARLDRIEAELAHTRASLDELVAHARRQQDLVDEMRPVATSMMRVATRRFASLEADGALGMGRAALRLGERVLHGYTVDDVDALADSVVAILDTVRSVTRPEILALVQEGAETIEHAEQADPIGVVGLARASGDVNVQKGLGILVATLRHVGRASRVLSKKEAGLRRGPAPPRPPGSPMARAPIAQPRPAGPTAAPMAAPVAVAPPVFPELGDLRFDAEGFLADADQWTEAFAEAVAADLGLALGDRHWVAVRAARETHARTGESPNIRRLTAVCDVTTKELYQLFPHAPGKTVARIAGLPKPVGCL